MAGEKLVFKEVLPKQGLLFTEQTPMPVLCKPKIMPMKSVTLEKLETMQKEAQEAVKRQEQEQKLHGGFTQQRQGQTKIKVLWSLSIAELLDDPVLTQFCT